MISDQFDPLPVAVCGATELDESAAEAKAEAKAEKAREEAADEKADADKAEAEKAKEASTDAAAAAEGTDTAETVVAWVAAIENRTRPTALLLSRQNLPYAPRSGLDGIARGAYVLAEPGEVGLKKRRKSLFVVQFRSRART